MAKEKGYKEVTGKGKNLKTNDGKEEESSSEDYFKGLKL